jgi:hypothetical protein
VQFTPLEIEVLIDEVEKRKEALFGSFNSKVGKSKACC